MAKCEVDNGSLQPLWILAFRSLDYVALLALVECELNTGDDRIVAVAAGDRV